MNNIDKTYTSLLQDILDNGVTKQDRTGTGTISVFGRQIRHKMSEGFPLITTKKMAFKTMVTELLWFLRGDTNIKYLIDNGCHIWDGDAYKAYLKGWEHAKKLQKSFSTEERYQEYLSEIKILSQEEFINKIKTDNEFAKKWGDLGPIYGAQWRSWETKEKIDFKILNNSDGLKIGQSSLYTHPTVDQIANLISELKTNPDSRRLMVNAWNVGELDQMVLPPCHYGFQVYTRELSRKERLFFVNKSDEEYEKALANKEQYESIGLDFELALTSRMNELNIPTRAISLMWNQRSVDTFLGLPFNIASYGLLLEIIAREVNMVPDELIGNLGDVHLYSNHKEQAVEQIGREPFQLPKLIIEHSSLQPVELIHKLENYQSHPSIKAPLSN
jgi:thymidylate synthase